MKNGNKRFINFVTLLFVLLITCIPVVFSQTTVEERLRQHVYTLADDSLVGRKAGSVFAKKAADYIVAQWEEIGLTPLVGDSYFMPFNLNYYHNLAAIIEGNDPLLKDEYIVIGAHFDHIGGGVNNKHESVIYNGADDNASGVAVMIELGRQLMEMKSTLGRSIILIGFDAEELGLIGSNEFADNPPFPLEKIKLMFSVDMVGWHKVSGYVKYSGAGTFKNGSQLLLDEALIPEGLHVKMQPFERSILTATDTKGFAEKGIPTLSVTTGTKSPYHKPEDMAHLIDFEGMILITEHLMNVVQTVSQDVDYHASGKIAPKHKKPPKLTFGVSTIIGFNHHVYTAGALNGKQATTVGIGLNGQLNVRFFALRPEIYYDYASARHPQGAISLHSITVPLNLVLQTPASSPSGVAVFAGPYYRYMLQGKQGGSSLDFENMFNRNEAGINWGFETRVVNFRLGFVCRNALTNFSQTKNADGAHIRNRASYVSLSYMF